MRDVRESLPLIPLARWSSRYNRRDLRDKQTRKPGLILGFLIYNQLQYNISMQYTIHEEAARGGGEVTGIGADETVP